MAIRTDFEFFQGEDVELTPIAIVDAAGAARDISGWHLRFDLRRLRETAIDISKSNSLPGTGLVIDNAGSGLCTVSLLDTDTDLPPGVYDWSIKRTDDGGEAVVAYGTATCKKAVSS